MRRQPKLEDAVCLVIALVCVPALVMVAALLRCIAAVWLRGMGGES